MREIKFRAWDNVLKIMVSVNVLEWQKFTKHEDILYVRGEILSDWKITDKDYQTDSETIKSIELMQFTGIKDKNGKDVYEGDIILFQDEPKYKSTWEVRWQSFGFRLVDGIGYRLLESETYPKLSENGEVISNIYETSK